jgi:hypothetical protein
MSNQPQGPAQASTLPTLGVFAILTAKAGVQREQIMAIMPDEIRATVQLHLEGKIREWYARGDGRGAIFLLNVTNAEEADSIMEALPLGKANLLDHEYIPVGPLAPLRMRLGAPPLQS